MTLPSLAIPAHNRTGTIADVEIIFLMQENGSFDHYFATRMSDPLMRGLLQG